MDRKSIMLVLGVVFCLVLFSLVLSGFNAYRALSNPLYNYQIVDVIDGDTVKIEIPELPSPLPKTINLRIMGIDTPEKGHLAQCDIERTKSHEAKAFVQKLISEAKIVQIKIIRWDKYARILGDVVVDGKSLSDLLVHNGHAVRYYGKGKRKNWCGN